MKQQTNLAHTIDLAAERARYDECAKKILTYKSVIAWILKYCTEEFSSYTVQFICDNCIKDNAEISKYAVHPDQKDRDIRLDGEMRLDGLNIEANSIKSRTVYYDVRFRAYLPGSRETVQFIINLEIQLCDTPGYPLVMRGVYYCARMVSDQYGTVFTGEHYEKIQKVYSIWICPDPAKKRRNGIFRYHMEETAVLGTSGVKQSDYDLMEIVVLNLGDAEKESGLEVLNLLNVLFSATISPEEKKQRLHEDFHIAMTVDFEGEVDKMCNLSQGLVDFGIEQGIEQGIETGVEKKTLSLARMMIEEEEPVDKIRKYTGYSAEKLNEIAGAMGKTLKGQKM